MSIGSSYYNGILRKYVIAFGSLFDGIQITRENSSGTTIQSITVPLAYAAKDKVMARVDQNPVLDNQNPAITFPRMSFEMLGLRYDTERKVSSSIKVSGISATDVNKLRTAYSPVPYIIDFQLYVYVRNAEDGLKIVEQIIPYFKPDHGVTINVLPSIGYKIDSPVTLTSVTSSDSYEGDFMTRKALIWTLDFTMRAMLFGPVSSTAIIKKATSNLFIAKTDQTGPTNIKITLTPGLLANGSPTTNSSASIAYTSISANSTYGIASDIVEN